ncbi:uncharacterized protein LOC122509901 [Leptopilina heterotoma]|uniref:uncharacterized protein LOC122509901 n=1 Tax=Leptopilina heterotoma TaxID=63436 RepID=UPI001CA8F78C|nr:uncharacterized protein LOC122509901 [Leptopilina heterotoma]
MKRILGRETRSRPGILLEGLTFERRKNNRENKRTMSQPPGEFVNNVGNLGNNNDIVIDELRAEIDRLRTINSAQNIQLTQLQNRIHESSSDVGSQLVRTLIDGLRGLNVETKIPRFCEPENPNHFIEKLEKYFVLKNLQGNRLSLIDGCFDGRARAWFESQRSTLINYADFKTKFLAEFFSIPIRVKLRAEWLARRFDNSSDNLQTYFMRQIKEAQFFTPQYEPYELHFMIIQQLPMRVREIVSTIDFKDYDKISQCLAQLDFAFQEKTSHYNVKSRNSVSNAYNENKNNDKRNQQQSQSSRPSLVTNSYIQANSFHAENPNINGHSRSSEPRVPLPDTSRPPPPFSSSVKNIKDFNSMNQLAISKGASHSTIFSSRHLYDEFNQVIDDVANNLEKRCDESTCSPSCPRIIVAMQSVPASSLIDTGSQITAVSEEFYNYLKKYYQVLELPVSSVVLFTAIGKKSTPIKKQIMCKLTIGDFESSSGTKSS